ncbi:MAG: flagellar hook-associated protein FlgK [Hyphomicrobium sp.]|jgi:flagellar hook-associated protein 1 FlgK|uniref:flagellar hook-associated protein FlgK n=1 Tax=Hyphomicrobium sp. TaxID=82 RepID=UPI0025BB8A84|nr:flagellar hook-associated protein FlgK [Hyphomicrobium sp.]MBX9864272.1 flagellar hook-associated protein FlgK [Hyphomicrobium sp.]
MSLSASLSTANSSLYVAGERTSVVSRNIANADRAFYTRKSVEVLTMPGSGVRTSGVTRAEDLVLFRKVLASGSSSAMHSAVLDSLDLLNATINDVELDSSPAALINSLSNALQAYSSQPHNQLAAEAAVRSARDLASSLNSAAATVQQVRNDADLGVQSSVNRINSLLEQFQGLNAQIVKGTITGADVTDFMDQRDEILANLSNEVGIRTVSRADNDMSIYTDSGVTLFDRAPRAVTFQRTSNLTPGMPGSAVYIDGVPVTGANATMPLQSGRIVGLVQARDDISMSYEAQLDEMARVLVTAFAESDQVGGGPDVPGLFTYSGATSIPADGVLVSGLASRLRVNANADPDAGGLATRLRDGGISDPLNTDYVYNTTGAASFTDRIDDLISKMNADYTYDPAAKLAATGKLANFSSTSAGWLQEGRKVADDSYQYQSTLYNRSFESFTRTTGVNLDEELSLMLEIERSFQTSSKLISVIDSMYSALLGAVG